MTCLCHSLQRAEQIQEFRNQQERAAGSEQSKVDIKKSVT